MDWRERVHGFRFLAVLVLLVSSAQAFALDPPVSNDSFVGTWQAQFQGKTFLTLVLANRSRHTERYSQ